MFDEIRPEGSMVCTEEKKAKARAAWAKKRSLKLVDGVPEIKPSANPAGRPKSIVNRVTEYGALFNKLNEERLSKGLSPLKTAMEVLIDAMQSDEIDIKDKARIADKLAPFESSRAPIITAEFIQNVNSKEESTVEEAMEDFMQSIRKV
jgi:hypothetical protein